MNIATTKQAYNMGYSAYIYGKTIFQNPFINETTQWYYWIKGWKDAEAHEYQDYDR